MDLSSAAIIDCAAIDLRREPICGAEENGDDAGDNDDDDDHDAVIQQSADTAMDESQEAGNDVHDLDVISFVFCVIRILSCLIFALVALQFLRSRPGSLGPVFFVEGRGFPFLLLIGG